ncbi:MAG TPA: sulfite exporter TauE/SafE family protein [Patescibacteria group bacterium]|nr:sulfite exporter TauE/SafE family protein [Patescibacteria group bacterium]
METHLAAILIISVAFFGEAVFGLGGGFISIPLLSLFLGVKDAVTLVLIFQFFMGFLLFSTWKHMIWKIVLPMTITVIIGTIIGTYMLALIDDSFLNKFLALTIFLFLGKMLFFPKISFGEHPKKRWGALTGLIGGWVNGITGVSSPIFTMYLAHLAPTKVMMRSALIYLFFVISIIRVGISIPAGLFTQKILLLALPVLPFFFLAIYAGHHVHKRISEKYYQYAIYIILFFSAILLLFKN